MAKKTLLSIVLGIFGSIFFYQVAISALVTDFLVRLLVSFFGFSSLINYDQIVAITVSAVITGIIAMLVHKNIIRIPGV